MGGAVVTAEVVPDDAISGVVVEPGASYAALVSAWHAVEDRSAWVKADLAAAVRRGQLERFSTDVGSKYQTVCNYRSVAEAWPALRRRDISFGVAQALAAILTASSWPASR